MEKIMSDIGILVLGLAIGSFLNVLIYRVPRHIGFAFGRSFCPSCRGQIEVYDNIPILSYLILRGKCRMCRSKIPLRYPLVEGLNVLCYLFLFHNYGFTTAFAAYSFLSSILIAIFFIDLEFRIIPDLLTLPGIAIGFAAALAPGGMGIVGSAVGFLVGGGILYLIAQLGDWIFKKESMGGGDIKMAAMLGAFLGWQKVIFIFFAGACIGLIISIIIMAFSQKLRASRMVPFGPFLATAAFVANL
jgi:leader peptidase (prepilin peptidase)/N-methyltransferase